ncbi:hypothetical protein PUNSTDRAFT_121975 [Punctularia strigosozonata HHB-11173 SS5]|uniref:uncharacterized protein n=1 Tax=Punctularia strigosozonata (strain HHB-11173) TaxID=741275 RepID=UPI0004417BC3|nr:uncharacterized protein PUNSTDRAFT_121975 [Punctularia strigosozonata HHB-11173 SS5]EIN06046.1 hypothetical protein PUNSTDRAFT_121975 [Punctularia strigosozonata HHB-11173 SS5]
MDWQKQTRTSSFHARPSGTRPTCPVSLHRSPAPRLSRTRRTKAPTRLPRGVRRATFKAANRIGGTARRCPLSRNCSRAAALEMGYGARRNFRMMERNGSDMVSDLGSDWIWILDRFMPLASSRSSSIPASGQLHASYTPASYTPHTKAT